MEEDQEAVRKKRTSGPVGESHFRRQESDPCGVDLPKGYKGGKDDLGGSSGDGVRIARERRLGRARPRVYFSMVSFFCFLSFIHLSLADPRIRRKGLPYNVMTGSVGLE